MLKAYFLSTNNIKLFTHYINVNCNQCTFIGAIFEAKYMVRLPAKLVCITL